MKIILSKINIKVGIDWRIELKRSIEAVITEKVLTVLGNTTVASCASDHWNKNGSALFELRSLRSIAKEK